MYCRKCGAQIANDARFCGECGQPVVRMQSKVQTGVAGPARETLNEAAGSTCEAQEAVGPVREVQNETAAPENGLQNKTTGSVNTDHGTNWVRLVGAFANGTNEQRNDAFTALYNASYSQVYAHVMRYARNEDVTNDAVQNAYIACWSKIDQLDNASQFLPWIKRIAYNEFLGKMRKDAKVVEFGVRADDEGNETPAEEFLSDDTLPMPEDAYASEELHRLLLQSIDELSDVQRVVLKGFYFESKQVQTLADELDIPLNTVKTHLSRGRKNLAAKAASYANAYGLKLVPVAIVPLMAALAEQDVQACEIAAAAAGGSSVLVKVMAVVAGKFSAGAAAGAAGGAAGSAGTAGGTVAGAGAASGVGSTTAAGTATATSAGSTAATGTAAMSGAGSTAAGSVGSAGAVGGSATGATAATGAGGTAAMSGAGSTVAGSAAAGASAAAGTGSAAAGAATAASGIAVKAGIGVAVAALAAGGGYGAYRYVHQEPAAIVSEEPEEPEVAATEATEETVEEIEEEVETVSAEDKAAALDILDMYMTGERGWDGGEFQTVNGEIPAENPMFAIADLNGDGVNELWVGTGENGEWNMNLLPSSDTEFWYDLSGISGYNPADQTFVSYNDLGTSLQDYDGNEIMLLEWWGDDEVHVSKDWEETDIITGAEADALTEPYVSIYSLVDAQPFTQENIDALAAGVDTSAKTPAAAADETPDNVDALTK